jgi:dipeptidyl aminopeptidase/acylaminoacyl peptidase
MSSPRWSPDGSKIAFLAERGEKPLTQVSVIPVDGGEAYQLTKGETSVSDFRWHPFEMMWEQSLKRSPIYWAHQSKTAVLIMGGAADTRVHPSQSLEYYRILKMNNHPAVRLVQYPGEGHGNRCQPGRIDSLYRQLQWLDWYIKDKKPPDGPMLPLEISESYGLNLEN